MLRDRGMPVTTLKDSHAGMAGSFRRVSGGKTSQLYLFTSHMRRLLRARLPLVEALDAAVQELARTPMQPVVQRVRAKVAGGASLSEALAAEPDWFEDMYVSMIRAAQASGTLAQAFDTIYQYNGRKREFQRRLNSALAYPMVLITVAILAVVFLMSYVVPKITSTLESARVPLPPVTRLLMAVSAFAQSYWYLVIAVLLAVVFAPRIARLFPEGRRAYDTIAVKAPVIRRFALSAIVARFSRTFASLLATGLRVADALEVAGRVSGNQLFEKAVSAARSRIVSGGELAAALGENGFFPVYAIQIVGVGERTGTLAESFEEIAKNEEEELQTATERFLTFLEPAIIVAMAVVVGFIVAAVLLPILSMSTIGTA
jgi:type II secretory pathway component PulF